MKLSLLVLLTFLTLSCSHAQSSYVGLQLSAVTGPGGMFPFAELQVGGPIADNVELRVSGLPLILINLLQVDLFYTQQLAEALRGYAGGGADMLLVALAEFGSPAFALHATAGVESQLGSGIGLFAEVQPIFIVNAAYTESERFFGKLALGVNFHF